MKWVNRSLEIFSEAATRDALYKKLFSKILQYSQENTRVGAYFLIKLQA